MDEKVLQDMARINSSLSAWTSGISKRGRNSRARMPTFLVIGAAKSASTSLHNYLGQHPDIYMSHMKEPNFFCFEGATPAFRFPPECEGAGDAVRARLRNAILRNRISSLEQYCRLFAGATNQRVLGESSVHYLYSKDAPRLIKKHIPDVRLVAILRNPADRAYSRFLHSRRDGLEPLADFAAALAIEDKRIAGGYAAAWHYRCRGYYHEQLQRYYQLFDRKQIHIMLYEDFGADPLTQIQALFGFLEVDPAFAPAMAERFNDSGKPRIAVRSWQMDALLNSANPIKNCAKWLLPSAALRSVRNLIDTCNTRHVASPKYGPLSPVLRRQLQDEYRPDILKLQDLIGKDLSRWLQ
jgi:hypothetical protein